MKYIATYNYIEKIVIIFSVLFFPVTVLAEDVTVVCDWKLFGITDDRETFIINIDNNEIYWVNENTRISPKEINEGRIVFNGVPKSRVVEDYPELTFVINRVTGELNVTGGKFSYSKSGQCRVTKKII